MRLGDYIRHDLEREFPMTRAVLTTIPADLFEWKPHDAVHSIGWNAAHLAEIAHWTPGVIKDGFFDVAPIDGPKYVTPEARDTDALLAQFDAGTVATFAALRDATDEILAESWSLKIGGETLFSMSKGDCLRKWVVSHLSHHRAILSHDLRMAGARTTSIFEE